MIHLVFHESLCMNLFVLITPITFPIQCSIRTGDQAELTRYGFQSKMEILLFNGTGMGKSRDQTEIVCSMQNLALDNHSTDMGN